MNASQHAGIGWDSVISCEFLGVFKPHPTVYAAAPRYLQFAVEEIMMAVAHNFDLLGVHTSDMKTAFVRRTDEWEGEGRTFSLR